MSMNYFAAFMLIAWLPITVFVFNSLPPRKAVAYLLVFAWLLLPSGGFGLPGLPDYTKMSATIAGIVGCMVVFDQSSLLTIRPRWIDLPMAVWCFGAYFTATANDLGSYEGASAVLAEVTAWGLPYLIGRIYFKDAESLRELAKAIVVGGLIYIPLCLIEVRLSQVLSGLVYGISQWEGQRFGGYRPRVFLANGLETGAWMANAALVSFVLWSSGAVKQIRGVSSGKLVLAAFVTSVLCKSTGALVLLGVFSGAYWFTRKVRRSAVIWLLIAIPPAYCVARTFDLWSGRDVSALARATVGEDRAESFEYRLDMERLLVDHALERPMLGWGRFNAGYVYSSTGRALTVPDGFWIIALGVRGSVGLAGMLAMFLLPIIKVVRQYPPSRWGDPQVAPTVALALVVLLTIVDFLSNAMLNPIYPVILGGLAGHVPSGRAAAEEEAEAALELATDLTAEGRMAEAGEEFRRAIELACGAGEGPLRARARAHAGLGHVLLAAGHRDDAVAAFRDALALRDELAADHPDDDAFADLAIAREDLSRAQVEAGSPAEAAEERRLALQVWDALAADHPGDSAYLQRRADALNDLAWLLATEPGAGDPTRALALAEEAVRVLPDRDASWNTLGVARYRAGDRAGAIDALERSALAAPDGLGTAFDHYFLAMAWGQFGRVDLAEEWLQRGMAWSARHRPGHPALERFRREAESQARA